MTTDDMAISRRRLIGAGALLLGGALLPLRAGAAVPGTAALIGRIEGYLNGLGSFKADFTQIAPNGNRSSGEVFVRRPGQLRFDYDPPSKILLVAPGDWRLVYYDGKTKQVTVIPISKTPLGILLDDPIRLSGDVDVVDVVEQGDEVAVRIVRTASPGQGNVVLVLGKEPLQLRRWAIVDPQGYTTNVVLQNIQTNVSLASSLFRWRDPKVFGYPDD